MSEWNVIYENFHTKHSVLTAPDEHMPYIIQLHIMSIRWAYYEQMKQQNIWSVHMTSIGNENRSSQCLFYKCNRVYCIHVPGHDPITFSFRSFSFLIGWGFYGQLSKVLKVVCWAGRVPFPPVSLQRQVVCLTVAAGVHVFSSGESL